MFEDENEDDIQEAPEELQELQVVIPLKDWHIKFNEYDITLVEGEEVEVPTILLESLKTEQVIK